MLYARVVTIAKSHYETSRYTTRIDNSKNAVCVPAQVTGPAHLPASTPAVSPHTLHCTQYASPPSELKDLIRLSTETVQRTPLSLERVHDVQTSNGLSLCMLGVGDGVTDNRLKECFQDAASLFVDHCGEG